MATQAQADEALFSLLLPITVTDALLTNHNVPEVAVATAYNAATNYALGQVAGVTTGNFQAVYVSKQAANLAHTPTPGASDAWWRYVGTAAAEYNAGTTYAANVFIGTTVGLIQTIYRSLQASNTGHTQASSPTWWELVGTVNAHYDTTVTYALADYVSLIDSDVHLLYKSTTAGNTGNALTDTAKWTPWGSTNARAMFDTTYGSQTSNEDSITFTITPNGLVNSLWFGNCDAASIEVDQPISGFNEVVTMNQHNVLNWYDFYYQLLVRRTDAAFVQKLPPYPSAPYTVTISNSGGTAKCGIFVQSLAQTIGHTQWEALAGIISYSGTTTDARGNTTFLQRAKVPKLNLDVRIFKNYEDEAYRIMTACTDVPLVVVAHNAYRSLQGYGSLGTWSVPFSNKGKDMSVEFKGLK